MAMDSREFQIVELATTIHVRNIVERTLENLFHDRFEFDWDESKRHARHLAYEMESFLKSGVVHRIIHGCVLEEYETYIDEEEVYADKA